MGVRQSVFCCNGAFDASLLTLISVLTHLRSDCGYDHRQAGSKKRRTAVDFTGCLAHAEITFVIETQKILRVRGFLDHNEACKNALMQRIPSLPLHPSVYQAALVQLANGVSLTDIQQRNREWVVSGGEGLIPKHGKESLGNTDGCCSVTIHAPSTVSIAVYTE